ncbi:hypothetical protein [Sphingopyxis terrae]|uniref:Uncharacterized protein n=1 Tax=Sphingopyxis terrae subsp. ummariensis TaxID=429001 RepID=A0A1Y6FTW4_9SPHN|nr:hypothetical protein [Sphingopyxis terrae]SMQ76322.1 hypothetical protein SAMN06295984_1762 [Sphingopyxis terrae subsp. ummariensis]
MSIRLAERPPLARDNNSGEGVLRPKKKRGPKPKPVVEFPEALAGEWVDPPSFPEALALHMKRHGDTCNHLHRAIIRPGDKTDRKTIQTWVAGLKSPGTIESLSVLERIERRYRLPAGYFQGKLDHSGRAAARPAISKFTATERRRLAWHLPRDFAKRPKREREEILGWVRSVIIEGATDYRRFQREATQQRFSLRFPGIESRGRVPRDRGSESVDEGDPDGASRRPGRDAPPHLQHEVERLIAFKTSSLAPSGLLRQGMWGEETASQKLEHLGLLFGALRSPPDSEVKGCGVPVDRLCLAMLLFPAVWDWYLHWREDRRGFYTSWEINMLDFALSLARDKTGWMRQHPGLADALHPVPGLISSEDIDEARREWDAVCDRFTTYALNRKKDVQRVAKVHRDPFEPILPILEAESPVGEYRKITEEILERMPSARRYPKAAAEAARAFLMLRFGLHLGLRQKNLRQLRFCVRGGRHTSEKQLERLKCGELRWNDLSGGWEVFIPAVAFKNASSSFFSRKPYRLLLPDLGRLYEFIDLYLERDRQILLGGAEDPETFFVKSAKLTTKNAAYSQTGFYEAWRLTIQRYGIYNPYTGRGAIKGLLPHGPHNVRDVLATHVLKKTGSYEQAGYAIQDSPEIVAKHYGRFFPQDKSALAAVVLNEAWAA